MNVCNSTEKTKIYFSVVFYGDDYIFQYKRDENCVANNFIIISKGK